MTNIYHWSFIMLTLVVLIWSSILMPSNNPLLPISATDIRPPRNIFPTPTLTTTPKFASVVLTMTHPTDSDLERFLSIEQLGVDPAATKKVTRQDIDITGDGQIDILFGGTTYDRILPFLAIFSHPPDHQVWQLIFYSDEPSRYWADIRIIIEDDRIIADFLTATGGTGFIDLVWQQRWIKCQSTNCIIIWESPVLSTWRYASPVSGVISQGYQVAEVEKLDTETIQVMIHNFALEDVPYEYNESGDYRFIDVDKTHWVIGPTVEKVYSQIDGIYQMIDEKQKISEFEIVRPFDQQTNATTLFISETLNQRSNSYDEYKAARANFWGLPAPDEPIDPIWGSWYQEIEAAASDGFLNSYTITAEGANWVAGITSAIDQPLCRLTVQQHKDDHFELVGRIDLPCIGNLTRLDYQDIDHNGQAELLLTTIPPSGETWANTQRLHIFSTGNELIELARFDGAINGPDTIGVRWEQSKEGFKVFTGLPLVDLACRAHDWSCVTAERRFQTYLWQAGKFQLISEQK